MQNCIKFSQVFRLIGIVFSVALLTLLTHQTAFAQTTVQLPGRIEAEDYLAGGQNVTYFDTTEGNTGGFYRSDDVDIQTTQDATGNYHIGWIADGEWLTYEISASEASLVTFHARVATINTGRTFHLEIDGVNVTGSMTVPNTGGWQNFTTISTSPISVSSGTHTLKFVAESTGFNLNYFEGTVSQPPAQSSQGFTHLTTITHGTKLNGAHGMTIRNNYAYISNTLDNSLTIIDISQPTNPVIVGNEKNNTSLKAAVDHQLSGNYAFVAAKGNNSITVVDVSNPSNPQIVKVLKHNSLLNNPRGIFISGSYAYVACDTGDSLTIVDISNPTNPSIVGSIINSTHLNQANSVFVQGSYAYVTAGISDSFSVINVSNPANPVRVTTLSNSTLNEARKVTVAGDYAYVASLTADSLSIIDISTPSSPTMVGSLIDHTNFDDARSVYVVGTNAFVVGGSASSLSLVDVSDPANPTRVTTLTDTAHFQTPREVIVIGNHAFVNSYDGDAFSTILLP